MHGRELCWVCWYPLVHVVCSAVCLLGSHAPCTGTSLGTKGIQALAPELGKLTALSKLELAGASCDACVHCALWVAHVFRVERLPSQETGLAVKEGKRWFAI